MGNPKVCGSLEIAYLIYYLHRQAKRRVTHRLNINIKKDYSICIEIILVETCYWISLAFKDRLNVLMLQFVPRLLTILL